MSELKARTARSIANEEEMLEMGSGESIEQMLVYPKSEVDKVIAKLKSQKAQAEALKRESHQKYKRCLAMANYCQAVLGQFPSFGTISEKENWWDKWGERWLALAEKFKEAK